MTEFELGRKQGIYELIGYIRKANPLYADLADDLTMSFVSHDRVYDPETGFMHPFESEPKRL